MNVINSFRFLFKDCFFDENTLDDIVFAYGGDEAIENGACLIIDSVIIKCPHPLCYFYITAIIQF